nr:zinc finger BED domain-containing protein RICESLEEPER 2-like [Ipomoea batatas]
MDGSSFCQQNFTTEPIEELVRAVGQKRKTPFTRLKDTKDKCTCNYCRKQFKCATTSGTSSLKVHNQRCIAFDQDDCRRRTIKMIVLDELHFSFVDGLGFKQFCSVVCPKYIIPSRRTITRDVVELYLKEKALLKSMISESRVSFTTDIWTAATTVSYMVITAHYIDVNWQLHRKIISFKPISNHKGETIVEQFENCLIDWDIKKVFTITVDNAFANDNAIRILKNKLKCWKDDPLLLGGEFLHVRCCAHILNLIVKDGLSMLGSSVVSVRNAVKYVRSSNSRFQAFHIRAEQEKLARGSLILDCNSRWNSTYLMLSAALKYRAAFDRMANEDKLYDAYFQDNENGKKRVGPPLLNDWENVSRLVLFLKLFYDATLTFSSYKKVTSNHCFNDICTIEANLNAFSNSRDVNMSSIASEMKKKFDKYWEGLEINKLLIIASVFDPRCKMCFVTICFEKLYGKDTPKCIEMKEAVLEVLQIARDVLAISVSSVASESAYSTSDATVSLLQVLEETEFMDLLAEESASTGEEDGGCRQLRRRWVMVGDEGEAQTERGELLSPRFALALKRKSERF